MNLNRRSFLKGLGALVAVSAVPAFAFDPGLPDMTGARTAPVVGVITGGDMADGYALVEQYDDRVSTVYVNERTYRTMRCHDCTTESSAEDMERGDMGSLWGGDIKLNSRVPDDKVYIIGEHGHTSILQRMTA